MKYTPETIKRFIKAIEEGATYELAAGYAGITFQTFNEWRKDKPEFSELVKAAEGRAAVKWLAQISKAAREGEWTAAAWKLERRYPNDYGKRLPDLAADGELPLSRVVIVEDRRRALPSPGETTSDSDSDD